MEPEKKDDIKNLSNRQIILLTLLITFVVSIATGIITVSLMKQMPSSVPQTINNVIQKTIEKVTTVEVPSVTQNQNNSEGQSDTKNGSTPITLGNSEALINIYSPDQKFPLKEGERANTVGQGVIITSDGLILVDSNILISGDLYKVLLDDIVFDASLLKKFDNGFAILKISAIIESPTENQSDSAVE